MNTTNREQVRITPLIAVYKLILSDFTNLEIAAINNGISGFGSIGKSSIGAEKAIEANLVNAEGIPDYKDELLDALSIEIIDRINRGEFK